MDGVWVRQDLHLADRGAMDGCVVAEVDPGYFPILDDVKGPDETYDCLEKIFEEDAEAQWKGAEILGFQMRIDKCYAFWVLVHPKFAVPERPRFAVTVPMRVYPQTLSVMGEAVPYRSIFPDGEH